MKLTPRIKAASIIDLVDTINDRSVPAKEWPLKDRMQLCKAILNLTDVEKVHLFNLLNRWYGFRMPKEG